MRSKREAVQCSAQLSIGFYGAEVADVVADVPKSDDPTTFFWQTLAVTKRISSSFIIFIISNVCQKKTVGSSLFGRLPQRLPHLPHYQRCLGLRQCSLKLFQQPTAMPVSAALKFRLHSKTSLGQLAAVRAALAAKRGDDGFTQYGEAQTCALDLRSHKRPQPQAT